MYAPSSSEVLAIIMTALVLYATGFFKAAGETTWRAIQDRFRKNRRDPDR